MALAEALSDAPTGEGLPTIRPINTVAFAESVPTDSTGARSNPPRPLIGGSTDDLSKFLEREFRLETFLWGSAGFSGCDAYNVILSDENVANKWQHFRYFRADLKIRVEISGNPFAQGLGFMYWLPYAYANSGAACYDYDINAADRSLTSVYHVTQVPHVEVLASDVTVKEFTIPFTWHRPFIDITPNSTDALGKYIGTLAFKSFSGPTSVAVGGSINIPITVYANFVNVVLTLPDLEDTILQSHDEYDSQPSKVMATISRGLSTMSTVPIIGPGMRATAEIAGKASSILKHFGFSKPVSIDAPIYTVMRYGHNTMTASGFDNVEKLTLDPKQETSLCVSEFGRGFDELAISYLTRKWGLVTTFNWSQASATGNKLAVLPVTPGLVAADTSGAFVRIRPTPLGYTTAAFSQWRGTIEFRIRFVATPYHRGRVRVIFTKSPLVAYAVSLTGKISNIALNTVIDLSQDTDVIVRVGYADAVAWKYFGWMPTSTPSDLGNGTWEDFVSGFLYLQVLEPITLPNSASTPNVPVLIYTRAGDDFEVAKPTLRHIRYMHAGAMPDSTEIMSGFYDAERVTTGMAYAAPNGLLGMNSTQFADNFGLAPFDSATPFTDLQADSSSASNQRIIDLVKSAPVYEPTLMTVGERIGSFREVLKRYEVDESIVMQPATTNAGINGSSQVQIVPLYPMYDDPIDGFLDITLKTTHLRHLMRIFLHAHGGTRIRLLPGSATSNSTPDNAGSGSAPVVALVDFYRPVPAERYYDDLPGAMYNTAYEREYILSHHSGVFLKEQGYAEIPYQAPEYVFPIPWSDGITGGDRKSVWPALLMHFNLTGVSTTGGFILPPVVTRSIAEDFSLLNFWFVPSVVLYEKTLTVHSPPA